jgi:hypothetical protein
LNADRADVQKGQRERNAFDIHYGEPS